MCRALRGLLQSSRTAQRLARRPEKPATASPCIDGCAGEVTPGAFFARSAPQSEANVTVETAAKADPGGRRRPGRQPKAYLRKSTGIARAPPPLRSWPRIIYVRPPDGRLVGLSDSRAFFMVGGLRAGAMPACHFLQARLALSRALMHNMPPLAQAHRPALCSGRTRRQVRSLVGQRSV